MNHCPLYNGQNLNFTGNQNPYGLIQNGGKRKTRRSLKSIRRRKGYKCKPRKTRKYRH